MAFKLQYLLSGLKYTLTGVVGQDGEVYWIATDIAILLGQRNINLFAKRWSHCKVRDITRNISFGNFNRKLVMNTMKLIQILRNFNAFENLTNLLMDQESAIKVLSVSSLTDIKNPTKVTMCSSQESESILWYLWLEYFKDNALKNMYRQNVDMDLWFANLPASCETPLETIPNTLSLRWKNKTLTYIQYTGEEPTEPVPEDLPDKFFLSYEDRIIPYVIQ